MTRQKFFLATALIVAACHSVAAQSPTDDYRDAFEAAVGAPSDPGAGDRLVSLLPRIVTSFGPPRELYVVEGDLLMDEEDLDRYRLSKGSSEPLPDTPETELIVHVQDGQLARWQPGKQTLRYSVLRQTFPDEETYHMIVTDMQDAGQDWTDACTECDVAFIHRPEFDAIGTWEEFQTLANADELRFIVVYNPAADGPIASAFFPTDPWHRRMVSVFPSYFTLSGGYTGRGVMRHEIGHILGYRHEHTRDVPGCAFEDSNWVEVTPYDPHSVMHYWCGNAGTRELELSDTDRTGHAANYGTTAGTP